ncbi:MAG: class C sortase [Oscillospiraceae bacterium]|nr:class C sortase [Oscillospiraceae bacterium]
MKKRSFSTVLLLLVLITGLSLLLYPSFSEYWNSLHQSEVVASYLETVSHIDDDQYKELWDSARAYNESLLERDNVFLLNEEQKAAYNSQLNIGGNGVIGYVDIPSINVFLPIYHGTDETVLQFAVGHLDWTSLPTGGESTHCVISGHRGLPSAKLFTDIDQLAVGDYFMLNVLDEVLTYEVDQIRIVLPAETDDLLIKQGKDYCTLVTCTPYGVNSHRMLVRGHRVDNLEQAQVVRVTADAVIVEKMVVIPIILALILLVMLVFLLITTSGRKKRRKEQ